MGKRKSAPEPPAQVSYDPANLPEKPDRSATERLKKGFRLLQFKHGDLLADRATLTSELQLAEAKELRLQEECDMILDQLLARETDDWTVPPFDLEKDLPLSDEEQPVENGATASRPKRPREAAQDEAPAQDKRQRVD